MRTRSILMTVFIVLAANRASAQQRADSAAFIVRLGRDTISVERYVRTSERLVIEAAQRSPSTVIHRLVFDLVEPDRVSRAAYTVRAPGREQVVLSRVVALEGDSAVVTTEQGGQARTQRVAARNVIPTAGPFYTPYEVAIMRAVAGGAHRNTVQLLANANVVDIPIERAGRDSVTLQNQFGEAMRAHIDARGRILHLHTPAFTTVERVQWIDLDAMSRGFAARDAAGKGLGMLSPRHTFRAHTGTANIWVDYSRPAARGRPIWGALVPFGRVWRMGANDAAHFATDRSLEIGGTRVEPGTYTLFLLPTATDWTLVINKQTGISGLDHDAAQDVARVRLDKQAVSTPVELFTIAIEQASASGGVLAVSWGDTKGVVPFSVK